MFERAIDAAFLVRTVSHRESTNCHFVLWYAHRQSLLFSWSFISTCMEVQAAPPAHSVQAPEKLAGVTTSATSPPTHKHCRCHSIEPNQINWEIINLSLCVEYCEHTNWHSYHVFSVHRYCMERLASCGLSGHTCLSICVQQGYK